MGNQMANCIKSCGWCCQYTNLPVPTNEMFTLKRMLELYRLQGHKVYKEPTEGRWYVLIDAPCAHWDPETALCRIYNISRADLCNRWTCHDPGGMHEYYDRLIKEGEDEKNIL